jgi:acetoin utilization deacetylase AcuC-like enzyme
MTLDRLADGEFSALKWHKAPIAERGPILRVHDQGFVSSIFAAIPQHGRLEFDATGTVISERSGDAALRAVGAVCSAVDAVAQGEAENAFCVVRPPGHHAAPDRTSGFCLFNNVAIGARHAQMVHGYKRIAIIDFDVHHGNGTQAVFEKDPDVFFGSTHQAFIFPGTGKEDEHGVGNVVNVTLARGCNGGTFRDAFSTKVLPRLRAFGAEFIFISAGFDAHIGDPIGDLRLVDADFGWVTRQIAAVADKSCGGRLVSVLEGGYNPAAVASGCAAHVRVLTSG